MKKVFGMVSKVSPKRVLYLEKGFIFSCTVYSIYELVQIYMKKYLLPNRKICISRKGKRYKPYWSELPPTNTPISQIQYVHTIQ
jgi:hypothetical protein